MRVLVTGATGFIGSALLPELTLRGHEVIATHRRGDSRRAEGLTWRAADLTEPEVWPPLVEGVDAIVHLAARAHVLRETEIDVEAAFTSANVQPVKHLIEALPTQSDVHVILVSSIGVNGTETGAVPFRADDAPNPQEPYARSKLRAEQLIRSAAESRRLRFTVIRPPLVYGPGAPGNFARLVRLVDTGIPLPLGSVANRRSLISVTHLVSFIAMACESPRSHGHTFLVADGEAVSTPQILAAIAEGLGRPSRVIPFPPMVAQRLARLAGQEAQWRKLTASLEVDSQPMHDVLGFEPRHRTLPGVSEAAGASRR